MKYFLLFLFISSQSFGQSSVEKNEIIMIGGIKQYVRIKGKDRSKPILLFLHGGRKRFQRGLAKANPVV